MRRLRHSFFCLSTAGPLFLLFCFCSAFAVPTTEEGTVDVHELLAPWREYYGTQEEWPGGHGFKPFKRWEWDLIRYGGPAGKIPVRALEQALAQKQTMEVGRADEPWHCLGPLNQGGRAGAIAFHPQDPQIIYAGAVSGGLYKSTDGGDSWRSTVDALPNICVGSIAIDRTNPEIVYLGTGEAVYNPLTGIGLLKSTDGGASWQTTGLAWPVSRRASVQVVDVDPRDGQIVLAADYEHLFLSTDGGANFTPVLDGDIKSLARDPQHPDTLLAAVGHPWGSVQNGIWRSTDGGLSWTLSWQLAPLGPTEAPQRYSRAAEPLPGPWQMGRSVVAFAPSDPAVVYAGVSTVMGAGGSALYGVYRSTDGGQSWRITTEAWENHYGGQGWFAIAIAVKPDDPSHVLSAGLDTYRSEHWGERFERASFGWPIGSLTMPNYMHVDQHAIVYSHHNPTEVWVAHDGGLSKSTDAGRTWQEKNNGFVSYQFYAIGGAHRDPLVLFGGAQDNGTMRWTGLPYYQYVLGGDGGWCVVDYSNDSLVWGETQFGGIRLSEDQGHSWQTIGSGTVFGRGTWIAPILQDPFDPRTLYATTEEREGRDGRVLGQVWVSHDQGRDSYNASSPDTPVPRNLRDRSSFKELGHSLPGYVQIVAASPALPGRIYAASTFRTYRFEPADSSWTDITGNAPDAWISRLTCGLEDPDLVYATFHGFGHGHVFKSTQGGTVWDNISANLPDMPCHDLVIDPRDSQILYVGTEIGVFRSRDGGGSWEVYGEGMPAARCDDLELQTATGLLRVGTHGRGIWEIPTGSAALALFRPNGAERLIAGGELLLRWSAAALGGDVQIELCRDYPGGTWETLFEATPNDGAENWTITPPGTERARFRITHRSEPDQSDSSNADCRIGIPALRILEPNGGETVLVGSVEPLRLDFDALPARYLRLEINSDYPAGEWRTAPLYAQRTIYQPLMYWLPQMQETPRARLRVRTESYPGFPEFSDTSDTEFFVREPRLAIKDPWLTRVWTVGEVAEIQWETEPGAGPVNVELYRGEPDTLWQTLVREWPNTGSYAWQVRPPANTRCRVRVGLYWAPQIYTQTQGEIRIVEAAPEAAALPAVFALGAPYPNPFNPETRIPLELPATAHADVRVYNRLGQEVAVLHAGELAAGRHTLTFDGRHHASGLYFIRTEVAGDVRIWKAVLVR